MNGKWLSLLAASIAISAGVMAWVTRPVASPPIAAAASSQAVALAPGGAVHAAPPGPSAAPVVRGPATVAETVDWNRRYREAPDFFALTAEMAGAALEGDARAAYVTGRVLLECKLDELVLRPYGGGPLEDRVEAYFVAAGVVSEPRRAAFRRRAAQCQRLFSDDPFAALELPHEAREFQYWREAAVAAGDALAVVDRATRTAAKYGVTDDPELARQYREEVLQDVRVGVASRDPAALLAIGALLMPLGDNAEAGLAWWAAACQSGYDCSNANPDIGHGCADAGTCDAGSTILDTLQRDLGAVKYAAVYAAGQDIAYKVTNEDWDGLQQYLAIK